jgi:hypothetical protein
VSTGLVNAPTPERVAQKHKLLICGFCEPIPYKPTSQLFRNKMAKSSKEQLLGA